MKLRLSLCLLLITPFLFGAGQVKQDAIGVSILRLIAAPNEYAKKTVRVIGFLHLEFEGDGIYFHREDYEKGISKNGFWVDAPPEIMKDMMKMNDHYVLIEGTFAPDHHGHLGMWSGAIININRAMVWAAEPGEKK